LVVEGRNRIPVTFHRMVERRLPVRLNPSPEEKAGQVIIEPAVVLVRGAQEYLDCIRSISTEPFPLPGGDENGTVLPTLKHAFELKSVPLIRHLGSRPIATCPATVNVRFTPQPRQRLYELAEIPVHFLCPPDFPLRPRFLEGQVTRIPVRVWGPVADKAPQVRAFIDLTGRKWEAGLYSDEPLRIQLPSEFHLAESLPGSVVFQLEPTVHALPKNAATAFKP
jgi:hypothetical protein